MVIAKATYQLLHRILFTINLEYFVSKTIISLVSLNVQGILVLASLLGIMKTLEVFCFPCFL